jgi:excisionase family DNA binding protein
MVQPSTRDTRARMKGVPEGGLLAEVGIAARRLGVSTQRVRELTRTGRIAAIRTVGGMRLYRVEDIDRLARERDAAVGARSKEEQT